MLGRITECSPLCVTHVVQAIPRHRLSFGIAFALRGSAQAAAAYLVDLLVRHDAGLHALPVPDTPYPKPADRFEGSQPPAAPATRPPPLSGEAGYMAGVTPGSAPSPDCQGAWAPAGGTYGPGYMPADEPPPAAAAPSGGWLQRRRPRT